MSSTADGHDRADDLGGPVADRLRQRDPAGDEQAERDGRVDVAARHGPDRVGHRQQRQPEGERDAEPADRLTRDHRGPHAAEHQHERPDGLRSSSSHLRPFPGRGLAPDSTRPRALSKVYACQLKRKLVCPWGSFANASTLAGSTRNTWPGVLALTAEGVAGDVEVPDLAVLGLDRVRELLELGGVGDPDGLALDDDVEARGPGVGPGGQRDLARVLEVAAFCSPVPVTKCTAPSWWTPISGVTCGRPSARTVVSQYSSARSSAPPGLRPRRRGRLRVAEAAVELGRSVPCPYDCPGAADSSHSSFREDERR